MPAFHSLSERQTSALVVYLRLLQGKSEMRTLPGDARRGKGIFFGKGQCFSCHTISGEGGFLGPDLSSYGSTASAKGIHDEIVRSRRTPPQGYRSAVLVTAAGDRIEGLIRNEDNFSVQFQTKDGGFHSFQKSTATPPSASSTPCASATSSSAPPARTATSSKPPPPPPSPTNTPTSQPPPLPSPP